MPDCIVGLLAAKHACADQLWIVKNAKLATRTQRQLEVYVCY